MLNEKMMQMIVKMSFLASCQCTLLRMGMFDEGPGAIRGFKARIRIKPDAEPIFKKARPLPYALKETVEKELDRLEALGIISN